MTKMRRICAVLCAALTMLVVLAGPVVAHAADLGEPTLSEAQSAYLVDQAGNVLYEKDAEEEMPMASTTKIMTAIVALESDASLDDVCTIEVPNLQEDAQMAGYVETDTPTFGELLRVMLVFSANDAAYNVAVHVAGSEEAFVDLMNQKAQELGMTHTHFANSHGLQADDHYSCAKDLVTMGRYALENHPLIAQLVAEESTTGTVNGEEVTFNSTDQLLTTYSGARGIKTGAVESGTCFVGACERDNVQLFSAVLGCTTSAGRFNDTAALWDWAYGNYRSYEVAHSAVTLRLHPYAYNFMFKVAFAATGDAAGQVWPDGGDLVYTLQSPNIQLLMEPDAGYGSSTWTQSGRTLCHAYFGSRAKLVRASAWSPFTLPLFYSAEELGVA